MEDSTLNKYQEGLSVRERVPPYRRLKIRRYIDRIYYCRIMGETDPELAMFEREIMPDI